jgi:DNA-binding transcriptional regulator PaaX
MQKYNKGEIAKIILSTLLTVGFITFAMRPRREPADSAMPNAVQLFKYFKPNDWKERARIKDSVARLERGGYVKKRGGTGEAFLLTEKGRERAMRYAIEQMRIASQKTWDKKWRLIMFDVPEEKMQERRAINFALKRLGCAQYQKSIFITPFPCEKEIDFVGECFGIRDHIRIVVAGEVEKSDALKKTFGV